VKSSTTPRVFEVERHIRGKWVCRSSRAVAPGAGAAHVIDKGIRRLDCLRRC